MEGCFSILHNGPHGPDGGKIVDMLDMVSSAGVVVKKVSSTRGGEYAGPCPGCGGMDRFRIWPVDKGGGGSFWCRGCGKGGDNVQFLVDFLGYQYRDAFRAVGRAMPDKYRPVGYRPAGACQEPDFVPKTHENPVPTWEIKASEFVLKSHQALLENRKALGYLAGRGLDLQAVQGFKLGWCAGENNNNCMFRPRVSWGLPKMINEKTGKNKMLWIPRGLVIPCFKGGKVHRIRIRRPAEDLQKKTDIKYYVLPGSGREVMGHNPDKNVFVVVEAELDEMMVTRRAGSVAGTVALGSAAVKPGASVFYVLQKALRVLVALDHDKAGQNAWKWWAENFENARQWPVPEGKDPGEAYQAGVDIKEWVTAGLPPAVTMEISTGYDIPGDMYPIEELKMLLEKYPVKIQADEKQAKILFDPGLKNRGVKQRIRDLFFGDDEVHWYLRMYHPEKIIHGGNCEVVKGV